MKNEVFTIKKYGTISIEIKEMMEKNGLSRNALARACNTRFEVINKWCSGNVEKIDADVLARVCFVLGCTPADIIKYHSEQ